MSEIRIGDAERGDAVTLLGEHYLAGRLTKEEYDERTSAAWAARNQSDLKPLFVDLPKPATVIPPKDSVRHRYRGIGSGAGAGSFSASPRLRRRPRITRFVLLFVVLLVLTPLHMPWWAWLILIWAWLSGALASLAGSLPHHRR